jgi:hypothetical protein
MGGGESGTESVPTLRKISGLWHSHLLIFLPTYTAVLVNFLTIINFLP